MRAAEANAARRRAIDYAEIGEQVLLRYNSTRLLLGGQALHVASQLERHTCITCKAVADHTIVLLVRALDLVIIAQL